MSTADVGLAAESGNGALVLLAVVPCLIIAFGKIVWDTWTWYRRSGPGQSPARPVSAAALGAAALTLTWSAVSGHVVDGIFTALLAAAAAGLIVHQVLKHRNSR